MPVNTGYQDMWNWLIIFGAVAAILAQAIKVIDEIGLRDSQKASLQKRFEDWWLTVSELDRVTLALVLASKLSLIIDSHLGVRLLSKRAFARSFGIATCILVLLLSIFGIYNGRTIGIAPWEAYRNTATEFEKSWSKEQRPPTTEKEKNRQQAETELRNIVLRYNTNTWAAAYSIVSLSALVLLNAILFFMSLVFSRLVLREIIAAGRVFSTITLLISNFALVFPAWTIVFLLVTILFTPLLWGAVPLVLLLSKSSVYWLLAFIAGGSIASLAFGSAPLKAVTLVGFLPCVFSVVVTGLSGIVLLNRDRFHRILSFVLLRCAEKGPLKVAVVVFLFIAGVIVTVVQAIRYMR
jgi:hypothetical protein